MFLENTLLVKWTEINFTQKKSQIVNSSEKRTVNGSVHSLAITVTT